MHGLTLTIPPVFPRTTDVGILLAVASIYLIARQQRF
jgi:hypothetical protein